MTRISLANFLYAKRLSQLRREVECLVAYAVVGYLLLSAISLPKRCSKGVRFHGQRTAREVQSESPHGAVGGRFAMGN